MLANGAVANLSGTNTGDQTITLTGDVTGTGTGSFVTTLKNTGTAGTYRSVTTDAQGRVTAGTNPTTVNGYGLTDVYTKTEVNSLIPTTLPASDVYAWAKASTKPEYTASEVGLGNVTNESKSTMFNNPTFTGTPIAPTAAADTSTTQLATTAFAIPRVTGVDNAIVRFDGETGKVQTSNITIDDSGNIGSGTQSFNGFGGSGFKNYIINGNFDIWQRGTSQTTTAFGSDDRWGNFNVNSTKVHSMVECTDTERVLFNARYFSRTVSTYVSGTSSFVMKSQTIENMTILAGKKVTVSFWAKADSNKVMNVKVTDLYGSGGTPTVSGTNNTNLGNVNLTSSWKKYSLTATLPSLVGKTLGTDGNYCFRLDFGFTFSPDRNEVVNLGMTAGQSGTFDIAQVQLEEGSVATPFENRPYGLELSLCQRYYEADIKCGYVGVPSVTNASYGGTFSMLHKRVQPTVTFASDADHSNFTTGFPTVHEITLSGFRAYKNSTAAGVQAAWSVLLNASAEL